MSGLATWGLKHNFECMDIHTKLSEVLPLGIETNLLIHCSLTELSEGFNRLGIETSILEDCNVLLSRGFLPLGD